MSAESCGAAMVNLSPDLSGIRFDDVMYSTDLHKLLLPGAATGKLFVIDPDNLSVSTITGFAKPEPLPPPDGGVPSIPRGGITSVAEGNNLFYVTDRTDEKMYVVDPRSQRIVNTVALSGSPDYVRYIPTTDEIWVTEPNGHLDIEVFSLKLDRRLPKLAVSMPIAGGPEGLYINTSRKLAYTSQDSDDPAGAPLMSWVIDLRTRNVVSKWASGCSAPKGVLGDDDNGLALMGCGEGGVSAIDVAKGQMVSRLSTPTNVDSFGFAPKLRHVYLPGPTLVIAGLSRSGKLTKLGEVITPGNPTKHAIADDRGNAWVLLPDTGQAMRIPDRFPATR